MMKDITLNLKHIMLSFALAMLAVSASAVNVTYSLTTHVDGRTITGTASVAAGADLLNAMPQALWRAYCTYSFTNNAGEQITTAPSSDCTVVVDYVFDPAFIMSVEGEEPTWNYLRSYNAGGSNNYYVYYNSSAEQEVGRQIIKANNPLPTISPSGNPSSVQVAKKGHREWAFYGDAYDFKIKINDDTLPRQWLVWSSTNSNGAPLTLGREPELGWQLYTNTASNTKISSGTVAMGVPNTAKYLASLQNVSYYIQTENFDSYFSFDKHNQLITSNVKSRLWWYAFFATPTTESSTITDLWHVTYKIQLADGSWYKDIVVQKKSSNLTPSFPPAGFNPNPDYEYDYFYLDANFKEKCADNYTMPAEGNTILYIKEIAEEENYISTPWMTLVLPYTIKDVDDYFGEGAVLVNEYTSVDGKLSSDDKDAYFRCNLNFTETKTIEANKPYMFRAINVKETLYEGMYDVANMEIGEPIEVKWYDDVNAPNVGVSMIGTFEPNGYNMEDDKLHFFFSSKQDETGAYTYSYVRRGAIIPCFRCYFYVTDERPGATSALHISAINSGSLTAISDVMAENAHVVAPIYSLDGRQMGASIDNLKKGVYIINGRKVVK